MGKHTASWKNTERKHSQMLGCSGRTGPTGLDLPDSVSDCLAVESKHKEDLPIWLKEAVEQADTNCRRYEIKSGFDDFHHLIPVAVLHESGTPFETDVVVMSMATFRGMVLPALEARYGRRG